MVGGQVPLMTQKQGHAQDMGLNRPVVNRVPNKRPVRAQIQGIGHVRDDMSWTFLTKNVNSQWIHMI